MKKYIEEFKTTWNNINLTNKLLLILFAVIALFVFVLWI